MLPETFLKTILSFYEASKIRGRSWKNTKHLVLPILRFLHNVFSLPKLAFLIMHLYFDYVKMCKNASFFVQSEVKITVLFSTQNNRLLSKSSRHYYLKLLFDRSKEGQNNGHLSKKTGLKCLLLRLLTVTLVSRVPVGLLNRTPQANLQPLKKTILLFPETFFPRTDE